MKHLQGIIPAMITPITPEQDINEKALRQLTNRLIESGVQALFVLGTNGEFFSLSTDERLKVASTVIDEAAGRIQVMIGAGASGTREAVYLSRKSEELGADCLSVITPYFNRVSQREVIDHYRHIADAVSIPIILYNIPARTGINLDPATVRKLAEIPNITGIKDSSGNFDNILAYIEQTRDMDFSVYAGTDSLILKTLTAGGQGAVAATANVFPELVVSIYHFWQNGNLKAAQAAQERLEAIRRFSAGFSIPAVYKAAVELLGIPAGPPVLPAEPLSSDETARLKELLDSYDFNTL